MELETITAQFPQDFGTYTRQVPPRVQGSAVRTQVVVKTVDSGPHIYSYLEFLHGFIFGLMTDCFKTLRLAHPRVWGKTADIESYNSIKALRSLGVDKVPSPKPMYAKMMKSGVASMRTLAAQNNNVPDPAEIQRLGLWKKRFDDIIGLLRLDFEAAFGE
ncbi:uncharacterized protein BDZ99DRAFT_465736 [Mytilinidion resinicola]|uniref:Uncharacterized protein n=1 Tax=Mytilinidion resinicola TaxID=574789 RepID=A0A6A6YEJ6_9PEZI|nr:uncharacterized protein BDZ99DRAFT_465736 [Mytilinidion resinicola]KAF2806988.1 hypothetical protein BDZ99DRAFT_465736 [Mytilinidion resinicola]